MQKKPGQISSNTLSLRFMKNAAKSKQERESEEAKAKVRSEEEWELAPEMREGWGVQDQVDDQTVSYEPSYLPFLFPGLSSSSRHTIPVTDVRAETDDSHEDDDSYDENGTINYQGRRKFGKHGMEVAETTMPPPPPPISQESLPLGCRSISSHGHSAESAAKFFLRPSKRSKAQAHPTPKEFKSNVSPPSPKAKGFMKPQVDPPRAPEGNGSRKRRPAEGTADMSNRSYTGDIDKGNVKKKKRKE